jgi:tetratricopeptide (TPR) repeat protein
LAGIVLFVFWPTLGAGFLNYDDNDYVYENPKITAGLTFAGIGWAFTHFHASNWHPLTTISHMLDCQVYGLQPWGHHLTNVLLHATAAILLFRALLRLTSGAGTQQSTLNSQLRTIVIDRRYSFWANGFVAALFAIHPLRVESVAWIAERKDVLSGVFFMLTLLAYANYARSEHRSIGKYLLLLFAFALGLMCKPTLVTVPFVLLLLDYWPLRRWQEAGSWERGAKSEAPSGKSKGRTPSASQHFSVSAFWTLVVEKVPLFALSAASCVVTIIAQREAFTAMQQLPFHARFANAVVSYALYLWQLIWPAHLAVLYPYPVHGIPAWAVVLALILLWVVSIFLFLQRERRPFLIIGWLWFLGMLVPMIGLVQVGAQPRADRYVYLPSIGLYILAVWGMTQLSAGLNRRRTFLTVLGALIICSLAIRSFFQTSYWRESETLWQHTVDITSANHVAENGLGNAFFEEGKLSDAIAHYRAALAIKPDYFLIHSNLGNALLRANQLDEAIVQLQDAIRINPNYAQAYNNLGGAFMEKGQAVEAISNYEKALQIKPDYAGAFNNLGVVYLQQGKVQEAITQYRKAASINPDSVDIQTNLGNALSRARDWPEAIVAYRAALKSRPDYAKAHNNLGVALEAVGKSDDAVTEYNKALDSDPNYPEAHCNLGRQLAGRGQKTDAIGHLTQALRLRPNYEEARKQLNELEQ